MEKRKRLVVTILAAIVLVIVSSGVSQAITITGPGTAAVGQNVSFTVTASVAAFGSCSVSVSYGDGAVATTPVCSTVWPGTCTFIMNHTYATAATFTAGATENLGACGTGTLRAPLFASTPITITAIPPVTLTATPNPAYPAQPVNFTVSGFSSFPCSITVDDGTGFLVSTVCNSSPCIVPGSRTYGVPGTYNATVTPLGGTCGSPGSRTVTINPLPPLTLTATPNPALIGQTVNVNLFGNYIAPCPVQFCVNASCASVVLSGSGFSTINSSAVWPSGPGWTTFATPGSYTLSAIPSGGCATTGSTVLSVICSPLSITSSSPLSSGTVGQAYSSPVLASGGQGAVTFSLLSGSLPPGLSLGSSGLISGTPTTGGNYSFTVRATDSCPGGAQTTQKTFSIAVQCAAPLSITSSSLPSGTVGQAYSSQVLTSGGQAPVTFSLASGWLPSGLTLSSSGLISGTPTITGTSSFAIRATDSCSVPQSVTQTFTVTINPTPPPCPTLAIATASLPAGTVNQAYSGGQITTSGGQGAITFSLAAGTLPPGLTLGSTGLITGTPATAGTYPFTVAATDGCSPIPQSVRQSYSVIINPPPCPALAITTASLPAGTVNQGYSGGQITTSGGQGAITFSLASGTLPPGLTLSASGLISGTPTAAGTSSFTVAATDGCSPIPQSVRQSYSVIISAVSCPTLAITTASLPVGTVNQAYSGGQITTSGGQGAITFSLVSGTLPPGLTLSASGLISGTPTTAGTSSFTVAATDSCSPTPQSVRQSYSVIINPAPCPTLLITTASLPGGTVNQAYSGGQIATSGGQGAITFSLASGTLPPGLTLSASGLISGTPTTVGASSFSVRATDSCSPTPQNVTQNLTMTINPATPSCPTLSITTASLPVGTVNQAYSGGQITTSGGQGAITFSLVSGTLPPGLTLSASGLISGTPTTEGTSSFTVAATDSCSPTPQSVRQNLTMTINPVAPPSCPPLSISTSATLSSGTVGQPYNVQIQTAGGQGTITFSLVSGALPPGLSLSSSGLISGMLSAAGNYSFTIRATDSCAGSTLLGMQVLGLGMRISAGGAQTVDVTFSLAVNAPPCPTLSVTSPSDLPYAKEGFAYKYLLRTSGGQPPITFSLIGSLPPGLTMTSAGLISGVPTAFGKYSFTIETTDSCASNSGQAVTGQRRALAANQSIRMTFSLEVGRPAPPPMTLSVSVTPPSFKITRGTAGLNTLSYAFSGSPPGDLTLTSNKGTFSAAGGVIGEVNTPITVNIVNGSGRVPETLNIPVAIAERAQQAGTAKITYTRTFSNGSVSVTGQAEIVITTEAGADFGISRIELYFENRTAQITVKRGQPLLKAYADIKFTGSGLLEGRWEVDGRTLSIVNTQLTYGTSVTIESTTVPPLPTFDTGPHIVRLVITNPVVTIPLPEAIYFVTAEEFEIIRPIKLVFPEDKARIDYAPLDFSWQGKETMAAYYIEFFREEGERPVFSAYAKKSGYRLPESVLKEVFSPGRDYRWKVKGFDANGNFVGESHTFTFGFKEDASFVPGQVMVIVDNSEKGTMVLEGVKRKYDLTLIEDYVVAALRQKVAVFGTKDDVLKLAGLIAKREGVIMVQPNYLFGGMAEQAQAMQALNNTLHLSRLHEVYRGRGVVVAVIDTGVDVLHSGLKGRITASGNFLRESPYRAEIHGTAVAGVVAADSGGSQMDGVAPGAGILALRACRQLADERPESECYSSSIAKAIDAAIERKARIINMSFGSIAHDRLIDRLIREGAKRGVIFVAPAGNMPQQRTLVFPASHPDVLAVAGTDEAGRPYPNETIASKAGVSAPATNVYTTIPGDRYNFLSGTSMSSASVTGLLALAIEKNGKLERNKVPAFKGDICKWAEELLKMPLCER